MVCVQWKSESRYAFPYCGFLLLWQNLFVLFCSVLRCETVLQNLTGFYALSRRIDWQLWCCMKNRFDWWGLRPSGSLAGGALQERWLYGRSVLLNGAHFELGSCSVADNGLITNVPVLQFMQCQQPGQKPWWAVQGMWGVHKKRKKIKSFGDRKM